MLRACLGVLILSSASLAAGPGPVVLRVRPAAEPTPALRYQLLPEVKDQTPGNAALLYQRAHSPDWVTAYRRQPDWVKLGEWVDVPLAELPRARVEPMLPKPMLREIELAARREFCDWELTPRLRQEGVGLMLPDVQGFREYGYLLALRARLEIADGKFDQAVRTLQTGFALSRHVGDAPLTVNALVGAALAQTMLERVEELVQAPRAPNLYWALTQLPRPYVDLRKPLQGERLLVEGLLPGVRAALVGGELRPWPPHEVRAYEERLKQANDAAGDGKDAKELLAAVVQTLPMARKALIAQGRKPAEVEQLPPLQAVLLYEVLTYDRLLDDVLKWQGLPFWEAWPGIERAERGRADELKGRDPRSTLAAMLLPAAAKLYATGTRIDRRIAALRCVEALRLHATAHAGKLPASLAEVKAVPLPVDPMTGQLFEYQVDGARATLSGLPPAGLKPVAIFTLRYELTLER